MLPLYSAHVDTHTHYYTFSYKTGEVHKFSDHCLFFIVFGLSVCTLYIFVCD